MSATDASTATSTDTVELENSSTIVQEEEEEDNFVDAHDTFPEDDNRNYEADAEVDDDEEDQFEDTVEDMDEYYRQLQSNMCSVEGKIDTFLSDDHDDGTSLTALDCRDGTIADCSLTIPNSSSVAAVSGASVKKNNKKQKKDQKPSDGSFVTTDVTLATTNESSFISGPLSIPDSSLTTPGDDDHHPSHMPRVLPDGRELLFSWSSSPSTAGGAVSGSIAVSDSMDPVNTQNNNNHPMIKNNRAASDGYFGLKDMTSLKQQVMGIFSSGKVKTGDTRDSEKDNGDGNKDGDKIITVEDNRNGNNGEAERKKKKNKKSKKKAKKD